jgi:hypothetical protein
LVVNDVFAVAIKGNRRFPRNRKNVAEQSATKGVSPAGVLRSLAAYRRRTFTILLYDASLFLRAPAYPYKYTLASNAFFARFLDRCESKQEKTSTGAPCPD